jgi:hypothetical protein
MIGRVFGWEPNYPGRSIPFKKSKVSLYLVKQYVLLAYRGSGALLDTLLTSELSGEEWSSYHLGC